MAEQEMNKSTGEPNDNAIRHVALRRTEAIDFATEPVLVKVGNPPTSFYVEETLLRENSGFFAAALKKEWREGQKRVVELPEEQASIFNVWLNWLYRRRVCLAPTADEKRKDGRIARSILEAYVLGNHLLDGDFMDAICDIFAVEICTLEDQHRHLPSQHLRKVVYAKTPQNSRFRKLLVYRFATSPNLDKNLKEEDDPRFLLDVATFISKRQSEPGYMNFVAAAARCEFHGHRPGGENCYRVKHHAPFSFSG